MCPACLRPPEAAPGALDCPQCGPRSRIVTRARCTLWLTSLQDRLSLFEDPVSGRLCRICFYESKAHTADPTQVMALGGVTKTVGWYCQKHAHGAWKR